jgi:hypothetical protein
MSSFGAIVLNFAYSIESLRESETAKLRENCYDLKRINCRSNEYNKNLETIDRSLRDSDSVTNETENGVGDGGSCGPLKKKLKNSKECDDERSLKWIPQFLKQFSASPISDYIDVVLNRTYEAAGMLAVKLFPMSKVENSLAIYGIPTCTSIALALYYIHVILLIRLHLLSVRSAMQGRKSHTLAATTFAF